MGTVFEHQCSRCGYSFETSGPWEFYRDDHGHIQPYGHPVAGSREALERGVHGLRGRVYCQTCDAVVDVVLEEFKRPHTRPTLETPSVWLGFPERLEEYKTGELPKCPNCGGKELILGDEPQVALLCPRCQRDRLAAQATIIS